MEPTDKRRTVALRKPPKRKSMRPETVASKQRNERKKTITMRVLMFGWEFPPHIAGGLGTASYGLTRGLAKHGIEVIFVVPKAYGDEDQRFVRVVNASEIETPFGDTREQDVWEKLTFIHIDSNMVPYVAPEEFDSYAEEYRRTGRTILDKEGWTERYSFSGKYGANLMEEVAAYAWSRPK